MVPDLVPVYSVLSFYLFSIPVFIFEFNFQFSYFGFSDGIVGELQSSCKRVCRM